MYYKELFDNGQFSVGYNCHDRDFEIECVGNYCGGPYCVFVDLSTIKQWVATAEQLEAETHPPTKQAQNAG